MGSIGLALLSSDDRRLQKPRGKLGPDFVIDGSSPAGSAEEIRRSGQASRSWVTGPDGGYADALPKSFAQAKMVVQT